MKGLSGTDPSGKHPPLIKHPKAPLRLIFFASANSVLGFVAGCIVCRTLPSQCLQLSAQEVPVMEIVGKSLCEQL
jgi:hypothetical protein